MAGNNWKGENFWSNFILLSIIVLELLLFLIPDKNLVLLIILGYSVLLILVKFKIEMGFYKKLAGITFFIGRTYWTKKFRQEVDYGIQKKIKYENSETLKLLEHPKIRESQKLIDKVKRLFNKKTNTNPDNAESESESEETVAFDITGHLYECLLHKPLEYELFVNEDEAEIVEFSRIFLLLPVEWDQCFDFGETDWIYDFYSVKINAAYCIFECGGWILGQYPLLKLKFSDKVTAEELDEFMKNYTETNKARELTLAKIIKEQQNDLVIFTEEREKLEIEIERLEIENDSLKLKLRNATHKPISEKLNQQFGIPKWAAYVLIIWMLLSFILLGVLI